MKGRSSAFKPVVPLTRRGWMQVAGGMAGLGPGRWCAANPSDVVPSVHALAGDGRGRLYASTTHGDFVRTTVGAAWQRVVGLRGVRQLAWLPDARVVAIGEQGLVISRDGVRWTDAQPALDAATRHAPGENVGPLSAIGVAVAGTFGMYVSVRGRGVWRSPDDGGTWQPLQTDPPLTVDRYDVALLQSGRMLYASFMQIDLSTNRAQRLPNAPEAFTSRVDDGAGGFCATVRASADPRDAGLGIDPHGVWHYTPGAMGGWRWWVTPHPFVLRQRVRDTVYATTEFRADAPSVVGAWHLPSRSWHLSSPLPRPASHLVVDDRCWIVRVPNATQSNGPAELLASTDRGKRWRRLSGPVLGERGTV